MTIQDFERRIGRMAISDLVGCDPTVSLPGNSDAGLSWAENNVPESLRQSEVVLFARRAFNAGAVAGREVVLRELAADAPPFAKLREVKP